MIKRSATQGEVEVLTYVCDMCVKEMPGAPIMVYYPYGHLNDSIDGPSHFCSDKCVVEFEKKMITKYGNWKSAPLPEGEKVRSSTEWRADRGKTPKARRATRKSKTHKHQRKEGETQ